MATIDGTSGNDTLTGSAAADQLNGLQGDDYLSGRGGDDTLDGGSGADTLRGGAGNDTYLATVFDVLIEGSNGGIDTVIAQSGWRLGANFENLEVHLVAAYITHASGNQLDNVITCFGGTLITVDGGAGDDTLLGGSGMEEFDYTDPSRNYGHDVVDGGETDTARFVFGDLGVVFDFRNGTAHGEGPSGDWSIVFTNVGGARSGAGDDLLLANNAGLHFVSGAGNDTLRGGTGDDLLYAEQGNDLIRAGGGDDKLIGGTGADVLQGGAGDDDLLGHFGADVLKGGGGNDHFEWWAGDNDRRVNGGSGNDTLGMSYGPMHLDLTAIPDRRFVNIESIDMSIVRNTLTLAEQDVLAISSTDTLRVLGSSDDTVDIVGTFTDQGVSDGFRRYEVGAATLLVDTDITNVS